MTITVYSKPSCVQCDATYRALDKRGIKYTTVDISQDTEALAFVQGLNADAPYMQAPVVHVQHADGTDAHWSGFRPGHIEEHMVA